MGFAQATQTWKQLQNVPHHKPTQRCMLSSVWWATIEISSKGLHTSPSPLVSTSPEKKPEETLKALKALKQARMTAPILVFADYTKPFLLETSTSKDGLGVVLSHWQADGQCHPTAYGSRALTPHEKNYHSTKLEVLVLKWAVTEHFKQYLPYQSFVLRMDNNPLTYILSTPNLDTMGHWWVGALAWFNFELEYHKGCDNMVADVLSQVITWLDLETVKSILDGVPLGMAHHAKVHDPAMVEGNQHLEQEVHVAAGCPLVEMQVANWAKAQREDPMLSAVLDWLKAQKQTDVKGLLAEHTSSEEGKLILQNWQNFAIHQEALYLCSMPKAKLKTSCSSWSPRHTVLPLSMGATEMEVIKGAIVPCPCCRNGSGGQVWPIRCRSP